MLKSIKEEIAKSKFKKLFEEIALDLSSTAVDVKESSKVQEKYLRDLYPIYKSCYPTTESIEDFLEDRLYGCEDAKPEFEKQCIISETSILIL